MDLKNIDIRNIDVSKVNVTNLAEKSFEWATENGIKLIVGFIVLSIGFRIIKRIVKHFNALLEKKDVDVTLRKFIKSFTSGALKILLVVGIFGYWGIQLSGLATIIASAGVAVGLALQGSLSNFAGGFIILLLRPFKVGDYIEAAGYNGTVEQIGVFYTSLVTIDNKLILIPNGTLSNGSLINYSAKDTRRVDLVFGVGYDADIIQVRKILKDIVDNHSLIMKHPDPFIGICEHGSSSVNFAVRVWCKTENYWPIYFDLLEEVKLRFDKEDINIPYPQMDLHLKKEKA